MELSRHFPLQNHNSFNVKATCPAIYFLKTIAELDQLPDLSKNHFYILGEGSNTVFVEQQAPIIIKPDFKGIEISELADNYIVTVAAGENWHDLVCSCLAQGVFGLENLALIPGSVGAAPVQNIGAYGVEFSDFCLQVKWYEFSSQTTKTLSNIDCQFSYRNSIFKQALHNKGIITEVVFSFPKAWQANLSYAGLSELAATVSAKEVMKKVIRLRQSKLPDPTKLPNAGSFFKNPIVNDQILTRLKNKYPGIPFYPLGDGQSKLAAGWLIEKVGLKGYRENGVGVHEHQALVLVNYESNDGGDIVALAKHIQKEVLATFDVLILPEVRTITAKGEKDFANLEIDNEYK